jgi:hypothetical protein
LLADKLSEVQMSYFYLCLCVCQYLWIIKFLEWAYRRKWGIWGGYFHSLGYWGFISNYLFFLISLFRFVFYFFPSIFFILVYFVLLSLVSFHFVSISPILHVCPLQYSSRTLPATQSKPGLLADKLSEVQMSYFYLCLCVCQYLWIIKWVIINQNYCI